MSTVSSSNTNSHYNPDEPRDPHGRWTTGGLSRRANPVPGQSPPAAPISCWATRWPAPGTRT